MSVWTISAVCLLCVLIGKVLDKHDREFSLALSILCCSGITVLALASLLPIKDQLDALMSGNNTLNTYTKLLMKSLGTCYIAGFASSACKDAGESGLSQAVEIFAKIAVCAMYLPVALDLLQSAIHWIGGNP